MLREVRKKADLSQSQLAEKSGINVRIIQYYEQGSRDINGAKLATLVDLAEALNCKLSDVITDKQVISKLKKMNL